MQRTTIGKQILIQYAKLAYVDLCSVLDSDNMDTVWHAFTDTVNKVVDTHATKKKVKANFNKQFHLSKEQRDIMKKKNRLWCKQKNQRPSNQEGIQQGKK